MSSPGARRHLLSKPRALKMLLRKRPADRAQAIEGALSFFGVCGGTTHPPDVEWLREIAGVAYDRCFHPAGFVRQLAAILASGDRRKGLAGVRVPAVVIHGTVDPLVLHHAGVATAKAIPGARFVSVEGMGHDVPSSLWPLLGDELERVRARAA